MADLGQDEGLGATLFWKAVPVLLRGGQREGERQVELTVRILEAQQRAARQQRVRGGGGGPSPTCVSGRALTGGRGRAAPPQVLRVFVSSEADPFFLHTLEVSEEDYALLRQDQLLRVDFANFAGKVVGLLERCIACREEDLPRWAARGGRHALRGQGGGQRAACRATTAAARAPARRIRSSSFSAVRRRSTSVATRAGTSSEGTFSDEARPAISARSLARCRNESSPT